MSRFTAPAEPTSTAVWRRGIVVLLFIVGYPLLIHWAVSSRPGSLLGKALVLLPAALAVAWLLGRSRSGRIGLLVIALLAVAAGFLWHGGRIDPVLFYPVPHLAANLFMLWFFGRTLHAGREPLITKIARYVHGTLPDDVVAYTRKVTWAWCVFFAMTVFLSIVLFAFAPLAVWSLFANVLSLPLLALMFFSENVWRVLRHPHFERASVPAVVRACRRLGESPLDTARSR